MSTLVLYAVLALGVSFCCSLLESVLLSVTPSYVAHLEADQHRAALTLRDLKLRIDRPLAAILGLNTCANTIGAAGVGAEAIRLWGSEALAIASAALTLLILFLSEIVPKTLGALYWRQLAPTAARILPWMIVLLLPLVWLSQRISTVVGRGRGSGLMRREEITALAELGDRQGLLDAFESRVMGSLMRFRDVRVHDIMTPRPVVCSLRTSHTIRDTIGMDPVMRFSRVPVWRENPDDVIGYVLKDDLLLQAARGHADELVETFLRTFIVIPESLPVARLLEQLLQENQSIAMVVNEYGGFEGIATMEDVVETVLGTEIVGEDDPAEDMRALARARWKERARRMGLQVDDAEGRALSYAPPPAKNEA